MKNDSGPDDSIMQLAKPDPMPPTHGRWAFAEFTEVCQIEADFMAKVESEFNKMLENYTGRPGPE
jgi:hypothetical protein